MQSHVPLSLRCHRWALGCLNATFLLGSLSACASANYAKESAAYAYDDNMAMEAEEAPTFFGGGAAKRAPGAPRAARSSAPRADLASMGDADDGIATPAPPPPSPEVETPATESKAEAPAKRLIIYTANFAVLVADANASIETFVADVEAVGGYLSQRQNTSVTVRVPVAHFQPLLDKLPLMGVIRHQQISSQDVTAEFNDVTLRLDTALKSRARLTALLERAEKMEDILRIEKEIRRLTQEIESMKGRLRFLGDQVAYSTITVTFQKDAPEIAPLNRQRYSRFAWIRRVGLERVLSDF